MTAEVQERHRRAALRVRRGDNMVASADRAWLTTGERLSAHVTSYKNRMDELDAVAQAIADAEERGRIEERVRCLALAIFVEPHSAQRLIREGKSPDAMWLDAARKELGE